MPQFSLRRRGLWAAVVLAGPLLAGCSSATSSFSSMFGRSSEAADSNASGIYTPPANFECPSVEVRAGAAQHSISANPAEPSPMTLRYQLTLGETARECKLVGSTLTMKVGVRGRVILGPAGGPGQVDVPIRFAVVREGVDPQTITTKFHRMAVAVPPNDANVAFSYVEGDIAFPMPKGAEIDYYVVYIGFDPITAEEMDRQRRPAPRPARGRRVSEAPAR
jgi:hypothetical protein